MRWTGKSDEFGFLLRKAVGEAKKVHDEGLRALIFIEKIIGGFDF